MTNIPFLFGITVASTCCIQASQTHIVYSENFNAPPFAVQVASNGSVNYDGAATGAVEVGEWFTASNGVTSTATTLDFTQEAKNKTRGVAVWLDTADWVAGTVSVTFDVSGFTEPVGIGSGAFIQTYTASGVDASNAVSLDIHAGITGVVTAATGAATINTLGSATAITANGTSLMHTFTYSGEEQIALVFVSQAINETGALTPAFSLDNLSVVAQTTRPAQPNIVILLADDLGWQDVKCYDIDTQSIFETPNVDALAADGVKFWQGYSPAPTCAPSRGAMMAGKHPARVQRHHVAGGTVAKPNKLSERMMVPYYSGRLPVAETTIPEALAPLGYYSGHSGKWHIAISHNAYPQPMDHGFDWTEASRGVAQGMKSTVEETPVDLPGRLQADLFATSDPGDPYQLDANGYAHDKTTQDALDFMTDAVTGATDPATVNQPFFLYYASWLVHAPIQMRTKSLLEKYALAMGVLAPGETVDDLDGTEVFAVGQNNPYYAAMVEFFDYNVYQIMNYLETTDDPRWPGHKLIDNTYIFLTSDNGGKESIGGEEVTDNYPLDKGKSYIQEGGTRVPFIIMGPDIPAGQESDVMVSGLDLFPTIVTLAGGTPTGTLDGCDLTELLRTDPSDPSRVTHLGGGGVRDTLYWHFPEDSNFASTIIKDGWKLFQNYDHVDNAEVDAFDLFQLYDSSGARVDIEEAVDVYDTDPEGVAAAMTAELNAWLIEVDGGVARYNPNYNGTPLPNQDQVPVIIDNGDGSGVTWVTYETDKAQVVEADLLYTQNGGATYEEWFKTPATIVSLGRVEATIPAGTTHYVFQLVDENNFLVSSEDMGYQTDGLVDSEKGTEYVYLYVGPEVDVYDIGSTSGTTNVSTLLRDSVGFHKHADSAWTISGGVLSNSSDIETRVAEGTVAQIFDITSITNAEVDEITISFDYTIAAASETLFLHLWGYEDVSSTAGTEIMTLGATNGNAWEKAVADPNPMTAYNLGKDDGAFDPAYTAGDADDAAATLTGVGTHTYTKTFVLSDFATAPGDLSLYDYLVVGFGRKVVAASGAAVTIDNLRISVPNRDGYVVWAYEAGLADYSAASATSDLDFDGLNNLLEYGIGGNPEQSDSGILPYFEVNTEATDEWTFTYRRLKNSDLSYTPECKKNLGDSEEQWSDSLITEEGAVDIDDAYELVTCTVDVSGGVSSIFLRLVVEQ